MPYDMLYEDEFGLGFRDQTEYDAVAAGAVDTNKWTAAESVRISAERTMFEGRRATGAPGAGSKRGVGAKSGTLTFRHQMRSQTVAFDADAGAPVATAPELDLLEEIAGQSAVGEWGGTVAAAPSPTAGGYTQTGGTGTPLLGGLYAFGVSKTDVRAHAVRKEGASPYTFWIDARAALANPWKVYPLRTFAPIFNTQPTPKTFDIVGANANAHEMLIGCMPSQLVLEMDPKGQLYGEFSYTFTDMQRGSAGGLSATRKPIEYQAIPPFIGANGGRIVIGANAVSGLYQDEAANADGHAGITGFRMTIRCEQSPLDAHHGLQGVHTVVIRRRIVTIEFNAPKVAEFNLGGVANAETIFHDSLRNQSALQSQIEVGTRAGQLFAAWLPGMVVVAEPQIEWVAGRMTWKVTAEMMEDYGEASAAGVGQTAWRVGFG